MKILILVLSFDKPPYNSLMSAQKMTWDAVPEEDVNTLFYHGGGQFGNDHKVIRQHHKSASHEIQFQCTDSYFYMADKFLRALKYVKDWDYDIIFRTNSSSYVNKKNLMEFAKNLPVEKLYGGLTFTDSNYDNGLCVSGAGMFLSKDCADILIDKINPNEEIEEDVYIGRILRDSDITPVAIGKRLDFPGQEWMGVGSVYHIRFKTDDRLMDAANMIEVHKQIHT